ncbi:GntR family transcriptional regulator [Sneathiella litorea]|nr:GntR family transcriptional regulator [Sneathiella litorea]
MAVDRLMFSNSSNLGLVQKAYEELEELIVTLDIAPGSILSEQALSKELEIGRTPIREALIKLSHEGLVSIIPRKGVIITDIDVNQHFRMLEFRREVERLVVRLACERATPEEREELLSLANALDEAGESADPNSFIKLDQQMDKLIYSAARNEFAKKSLQSMSGLTRRFWFRYHKSFVDVQATAKMHSNIAKAVANSDAESATKALDDLLDYIGEMTHESVASGGRY